MYKVGGLKSAISERTEIISREEVYKRSRARELTRLEKELDKKWSGATETSYEQIVQAVRLDSENTMKFESIPKM